MFVAFVLHCLLQCGAVLGDESSEHSGVFGGHFAVAASCIEVFGLGALVDVGIFSKGGFGIHTCCIGGNVDTWLWGLSVEVCGAIYDLGGVGDGVESLSDCIDRAYDKKIQELKLEESIAEKNLADKKKK